MSRMNGCYCRTLRKLRNRKTGEIRFADSFAFWEDLGNGMLQPVISRQNEPSFEGMKVGEGWNGWVLHDDVIYHKNTSMNNVRRTA